MIYPEEDYLALSGLQHFAFCRRQWALIHIENQWSDNERTVDGTIIHERAHDETIKESRGNIIVVRGMHVSSPVLGVSGVCDIIEYHSNPSGVPIFGHPGTWIPYPVEYKRGHTKDTDADRLQLCAQAMCLEEMLGCDIEEGALYYNETRRREKVLLTDDLREKVKVMILEMHHYYQRGYTPKVKRTKSCNACSLKDICTPALLKNKSALQYMQERLEEPD